ncbi:MAG TPA: hypothetical protein VEF53_04485 [Patescibacteria group bacterium]|nr:hypothetical protein [Patescibacteria group bacterium]
MYNYIDILLCKDAYKEVIIVIVDYSFNCSWNSPKKERISNLISERVLLLAGPIIFGKIDSIRFYEKQWIEDNLSENSYILPDVRLAALHIAEGSCEETYELVLEKDILLSMLTPGAGQSHFDNLILEFRNAIQNN